MPTPTPMNTTASIPSAPADARTELHACATRIEEHRTQREWSISELMRRHGGSEGLGSDKTFGKILNSDFTQLNLDKQLINYRTVLCLLDEQPAGTEEEEIFPELSGPKKLRKALLKAMQSQTPAKLIIVEGPSGIGKTSTLGVVRKLYGARILPIEASAAWSDRPNAMLIALGTALGDSATAKANSQAERLNRIVARLNEQRRCLAIEEAHHLGPQCLNTLKTLLNQTDSEAILIAIPTLLRRLEHAAYEEALQLTRNRLCERIRLDKINPTDVKILLTRRLPEPGLNGSLDRAADFLATHAPRHGNLGFVREVIRRTNAQLRDHPDTPLNLDLIEQAAAAEIACR
jgi:DNA transposition AAA+ family ATPase